MSSTVTIKWRERLANLPGFRLYEDVLDSLFSETKEEPPVYLRLEGVAARLRTLDGGGAAVTVTLPRIVARELGLLPNDANSGSATDSTP